MPGRWSHPSGASVEIGHVRKSSKSSSRIFVSPVGIILELVRNQVRKCAGSFYNLIRHRGQLSGACDIAVNLLHTLPRGTPAHRQNVSQFAIIYEYHRIFTPDFVYILVQLHSCTCYGGRMYDR